MPRYGMRAREDAESPLAGLLRGAGGASRLIFVSDIYLRRYRSVLAQLRA